MQAICKEAGVSPGGLYLYFPSKEALIAGLIECDREEIRESFSAAASAEDVLEAMTAVGRRHFVDEPRSKSMMTLQIWAESARDPSIRTLCQGIERDVRENLVFLCETLQRQGRVAPGVDIQVLVDVLMIMSDGIFKMRALDDGFDGERAMAAILAVFGAGIAGHLDFHATTHAMPEQVS